MKQNKILFMLILVLVIVLGVFSFAPNTWLSFFANHDKSTLRERLIAIESKIPTQTGKNLFLVQSHNLTTMVDPELVNLDSQIISCDANVENLLSSSPSIGGSCVGGATALSSTKGMYLGGQCCGAMTNLDEYHENLRKLQSYKNIPDIPLNPHKTPIPLAKKWIDYDKTTTLTAEQQQIYDEAIRMSKEGPCCCKCWHYYVNEGIAKKLIKDYNYNSKQIDDYWAASDIC